MSTHKHVFMKTVYLLFLSPRAMLQVSTLTAFHKHSLDSLRENVSQNSFSMTKLNTCDMTDN